MIVRPWKKGDTERIDIQSAQQSGASLIDLSTDLTPWSDEGLAWTAEHEDQILACWGMIPQWQGRGVVWSILSKNCGPHFVVIHKSALSFLAGLDMRRLEAQVDVGFDQGVRWMRLLGFELESYKRAFRPDGADMLEFVRIAE
jgi:hypothetical protein